jgi:cell division protein FtsA
VVDGHGGIQMPVGMAATRLETEMFIVTAASSTSRNLRRAVDRAGLRIEQLVLQPLASSIALLGEAERESGVALVEVKDAGTDLSVFRDGRIRQLTSIPWGETTVVNDIVKGLGVSIEEGVKLKERYGAARTAEVDPNEEIEISGPVPGSRRRISRELLAHIIEQRLDEVLGLAYDRMEDEQLRDQLDAGVVLSGSGMTMPGVSTLAQHVFGASVRVGRPGIGLTGMVKPVEDPRFATAVGLALYGAMRPNGRSNGLVGKVCGRVTEWLKDFF